MKMEKIPQAIIMDMGSEAFSVSMYCILYRLRKGKFPSRSMISKDFNIPLNKVHSLILRAKNICKRTPYSQLLFSKGIFKFYDEVSDKITVSKQKEKERKGKAKNKFQKIWEKDILSNIPKGYLHERNSNYYYKVQSGILNLYKYGLKESEIPLYVKWFVDMKLPKLNGFNVGILTCNNMVEEFKQRGGSYLLSHSRKRIEDKKGIFEEDASNEEKKLYDSIIKKKNSSEDLDEFEEEALQYFFDKYNDIDCD